MFDLVFKGGDQFRGKLFGVSFNYMAVSRRGGATSLSPPVQMTLV